VAAVTKTIRTLALALLAATACSSAEPAAVVPVAADAGEADPLATLPDALVLHDGRRVTTKEEWPERRAEILELFRANVYGRSPGAPEQLDVKVLEDDVPAMDGAATLRRVAITSRQAGREHTFEMLRFAPAGGARSGAFLLVNTRPPSKTDPTRATKSEFWPAEEVVARGYAIAAIQADDLAPDDKATFTSGVIRLFEGDAGGPRPPDAWKAIGAWSWGASRAMDALAVDPHVDPTRVAVLGHSRGGKAALWAGAQDERFSLVISNESGCAGASLSRIPIGENVALVTSVYPHWFADTFAAYAGREQELPIDQHELFALVAPRAVAVGSASDDEWSDPKGEYLGLAYASSVYALWGSAPVPLDGMPPVDQSIFVAPRGYHMRAGTHDMKLVDWQRYMDVADAVWARP
jgi:hypothetical protein